LHDHELSVSVIESQH